MTTQTLAPASIPFPAPDPHYAYVRARRRNSGLTSVRWYDDDTLFAGDFAAKTVYRVRPFTGKPIEASIPTPSGSGEPTETDLMDIRDDRMVLTNFYTGEVAFYDVGRDSLRFDRVLCPPRRTRWTQALRSLLRRRTEPDATRSGRKIHGVRFVPGYSDLLWVSYCDVNDKGVEILTLDGRPVHSIATSEQSQDAAFVTRGGTTFVVQAARTNHITVNGPNESQMYATIYIYRLPDDLRTQAPELLTARRFSGHLDALKEYRGSVYAVNQHDDCVDQFTYLPETNEVRRDRRLDGFDMPHGLDIRHDGLMAVTNYGPQNDLRFMQL